MNAHAVEVEQRYPRPILAAFHGVWSLGGVLGGSLIAAGLYLGADIRLVMLTGGIVAAALFLPTTRLLLTRGRGPREIHEARAAPLPRRLVLLLGIVAFAAFIAEGAAMDWSALYANTVLGADLATSSLAFTTFTVAMTVTRFLGDRLRGRYGPVWTIQRAAATATIGYALVILAPSLPVALLGAYAGWLLVGVGLAMVIPLVFAVAGAGGAAAGRALARVTTFGYVGMLAGPSVIGPLAEETSLRLAMVLPGALAFGIAVVAPVAVRRATGLVRVAPAPVS